MRNIARIAATLLSVAPVLVAIVQLGIDLAVPPDHAPAPPQPGPSQIIGPVPRGGAPLRIVLPKADSPYDTVRLRSVTWGSSPLATIEVCCGARCTDTRTAVEDWGPVRLRIPACGTGAEATLRVLELRGGAVGWIGSEGVPAVRPVLSRSWVRPLQRARAYFALSGWNAFGAATLGFLFVTVGAVFVALSPHRHSDWVKNRAASSTECALPPTAVP